VKRSKKCTNAHCHEFPILPKCLHYCIEKVVRDSTDLEKRLVFEMSESLIHNVNKAYTQSNPPIKVHHHLYSRIGESSANELKGIFKEPNTFLKMYLKLKKREKKVILQQVRSKSKKLKGLLIEAA